MLKSTSSTKLAAAAAGEAVAQKNWMAKALAGAEQFSVTEPTRMVVPHPSEGWLEGQFAYGSQQLENFTSPLRILLVDASNSHANNMLKIVGTGTGVRLEELHLCTTASSEPFVKINRLLLNPQARRPVHVYTFSSYDLDPEMQRLVWQFAQHCDMIVDLLHADVNHTAHQIELWSGLANNAQPWNCKTLCLLGNISQQSMQEDLAMAAWPQDLAVLYEQEEITSPTRVWGYMMRVLRDQHGAKSKPAPLTADASTALSTAASKKAAQSSVTLAEIQGAAAVDIDPQTAPSLLLEINMTTMNDTLAELMKIDGANAVAIVDSNSGMLLGKAGSGVNLDVAAAGNTEVVKAKLKTMKSLGITGSIEDILITLDTQYHIIRLVPHKPGLFIYCVLDRVKSNLAMARYKIMEIEKGLVV